MRNTLLFFLIVLTACSSNSPFEGTYKHKICKYASTCYYFEFFNDGTFRYNVTGDMKRHKAFNGSWTFKQDTVYLEPEYFIFPDSTEVELLDNKESHKTDISISMLGGYENGQEPDTSRVMWYISLDGGTNYTSTDQMGKLSIKKQYIHKIMIRDVLQQMGQNQIFRHRDSIFEINAEVDEVNIFLALREKQPDELASMPRKLYWKGDNLIPVDFVNQSGHNNYYTRSKDNE